MVTAWAEALPDGAAVLDVGAGSGLPLTAALIAAGLAVSAIDASPNMVAAFKANFPGTEVACEPAETSPFFNRRFDGILAVGLLFLLPAKAQRALIQRFAETLKPDGQLLFSAPWQVGTWDDLLTGQTSASLGDADYRCCLEQAGLTVTDTFVDDGNGHYYAARKPVSPTLAQP
ncbi:MAG: class I SAM-dependent methyltransferase [Pseudomonadota bacterium]